MATNDQELIEEVRSLTDYQTDIISESKMQDLVALARREIETEVGTVDDFYADNISESALFWLVCFYSKIKSGEFNGPNISVSEVEITRLSQDENGDIWANKFGKRLRQLRSSDRTYTSSISRTDRSYSGDRSTASYGSDS